MKMTRDEIGSAVWLYQQGLTCVEIGKQLKRDAGTISRNLKKAQIQLRTYRDYYAEDVDELFFQTIDTEQKAYWFGYIAADACISESVGDFRAFHFTLQRRDRIALEQFKTVIGYTGKIYDYVAKKKNNKLYPNSSICFNNKIFCEQLLSKGWLEFKRNDDIRLMTYVPHDLFIHFVRGFFDGDGCVSRSKKRFKSHYFSFAGSYNVLDFIENWLIAALAYVKKSPKKSKSTLCWRMGWNGNDQVRRFGELLYKDATVWLQRKRDKFDCLNDAYGGLPTFHIGEDNEFYYPLSHKEISLLPTERRQLLADQFFTAIRKRPWVNPTYNNEDLKSDYNRVKLETTQDYYAEGGFNSHNSSFNEFAGRKLLIHFQQHYWNTRYRASKTLVEGWNDDKIMRKAVDNLFLTKGGRPCLARLLRELNFAGARRVSHFHPGLAKAVISHYAPDAKSYLDPCAGWGARLLAASVLGLEYVACDPNYLTIAGLKKLAGFVGFDCELNETPYEAFETDRRFDIVFTSPPYFSVERYEHGEQSYKGKRGYEDWVVRFLVPLIDNSRQRSDVVVLHVSEKIRDSIQRLYKCKSVIPAYLQKTAGKERSAEWLVEF